MNNELKTLEKLIAALHENLLASSEQYRALVLLQRTMEEAGSAPTRANPAISQEHGKKPGSRKPEPADKQPLRVSVFEILSASKTALSVTEILAELAKKGASPNARNPRASLSSNLSQDERFENVFADGKPVWRISKAGRYAGASGRGPRGQLQHRTASGD